MPFGRLIQTIHDALEGRRARIDPVGYSRSIGVRVGADCRLIGISAETFGSEPYLVRLGEHVTIASGVRFVTHDGGVWVFRREHPNIDVFGPIAIGDNAFVGINSIIMPGVTIGSDCVIGAGSVVTCDIPSNTVAAGVPARPIRSLDEYRERVIAKASHIRDWSEPEKRDLLERCLATGDFASCASHGERLLIERNHE